METIVTRGTGTYGVLGNNLVVSIDSLDQSVDGEGYVEFFTQVARDFARYVADSHGIPAENYPAFEQDFIDAFFAELDTVEPLAIPGMQGISAYVIEGDILSLATMRKTGVTTWEFHRLADSTAVAATTWGSLKAAWRR